MRFIAAFARPSQLLRPYFPTRIQLSVPDFENPPTLDKDGYFNLPQGPGLGMTIKKEFLTET
jgi:L-alanine-DL-glutamate epimerase-like enolase superfamily enzyme